ncbi:transglutaminase-like domain-containing protein [Vibrio fluminensis]|uniref:transglutaminase-like domain-containing protein n=1 Tax=Vibrio fluminensis TaxID=2783614 RepID=UPI001888E30A|nr:transglutaminase family protein [Vibrio fluminensis]
MQQYLQQTEMLDFDNASIQQLIKTRTWHKQDEYDAIDQIYSFVRDEIVFGYNSDDTIPASQVLKDGYGQCNTKGTLFMALLRAVGIPTRLHGFTINNQLQLGAIPKYFFKLAPEKIMHSWVEVYFNGKWVNLEGYILDKSYLSKVKQRFGTECSAFSGYGVAVKCLRAVEVDWLGRDTYIQKEGIADDFGIYAQPDTFYLTRGSNLRGAKKLLYCYVLRHLINSNVKRIRKHGIAQSLRESSNTGAFVKS